MESSMLQRKLTINFRVILTLIIAATGVVSSASSKTLVSLQVGFMPSEDMAELKPTTSRAMLARPVVVNVLDRRQGDKAYLGDRTDDDDGVHQTRATNEIKPFFRMVVMKSLTEWGIKQIEGAPLKLEVSLLELHMKETNEAIGSIYDGSARVELALSDADGEVLWRGSTAGNVTTEAPKFSDEYCNEVLSDALLQALVIAFNAPGLHGAWEGVRPPVVANGRTGIDHGGISPERLLEEIRKLSKDGFETSTQAEYARGRTLTRRLTLDDISLWRQMEVREEVIRAALTCKVHE